MKESNFFALSPSFYLVVIICGFIHPRCTETYLVFIEPITDEVDQRIASLVDALEAAKQSKEQAQLATRHALMEEQERSAQYLECLKAAEKSSEVANRRAQIATNEVVNLRNDLNALREDLSKAHEDLATEKLKCSAAVNKIQQVGWLVDWMVG
ncbi:unnamed protein product [Hydatigera taeniaeformis]|uniref:Uncharacterized protein n=1 Tax=Hydatigena taeniaeformis TaxID=6205 RepID=A0A3P7G4G0_HYDTA|nr:unnamed protein product [Hydatigera taeniaeformis]